MKTPLAILLSTGFLFIIPISSTHGFTTLNQGAIVWHQKNTEVTTFWGLSTTLPTTNNLTRSITLNGPNNQAPPYEIVATADFNRDGHSDILWRDKGTSGQMVIWYMYYNQLHSTLGGQPILANAHIAWDLVGCGDFDRDGRVDILFNNRGTNGVEI